MLAGCKALEIELVGHRCIVQTPTDSEVPYDRERIRRPADFRLAERCRQARSAGFCTQAITASADLR